MRYLLLLLFLLTGCSSFGPATVPNDQFNYSGAIAHATRDQLLMNMVRMRYYESLAFLRVSSVISQYTRAASINAGVGLNSSATGGDTATAGARARWSDRPTITYTPVAGQDFAKDLLTPMQPTRLMELLQAGWSADLVIGIATFSVNGVDNYHARPPRQRDADAEFHELFSLWHELGESGLVELRQVVNDDGAGAHQLVRRAGNEPTRDTVKQPSPRNPATRSEHRRFPAHLRQSEVGRPDRRAHGFDLGHHQESGLAN